MATISNRKTVRRVDLATILLSTVQLAFFFAPLGMPLDVWAQQCPVCRFNCHPDRTPNPNPGNTPPERTDDPVYLRFGSATEMAADLEIPGPLGVWTLTRTYTSQAEWLNASSYQGWGWLNNQTGRVLVMVDSTTLNLVEQASDVLVFKLSGGTWKGVNTDLYIKEDAANHQFIITDTRTGDVTIFYNFDDPAVPTTKRGKLKQTTTTWWRGAGLSGTIYDYDTNGELQELTTPSGQEYSILFTIPNGLLTKVEVKNSSNNVIAQVEYTYFEDGQGYAEDTTSNEGVGVEGDLIQVKVTRLTSTGTDITEASDVIVRYTQYRYDDHSRITAIFNHDGIFSLIDNNSNFSSPGDILTETSDYATGSSGSHAIKDFADRLYSYYAANFDTEYGDENLYQKYGGYGMDETGFVKDGINRPSGCASCNGGSAEGIKYNYRYMTLANLHSSPLYRDVVLIVVEDVTNADGVLDHRTVWGLNNAGNILRQVVITDPLGTPTYWCSSRTYFDAYAGIPAATVGRIGEYRLPSAHVGSVTDTTTLKKFLNPSTGSNDYDTNNLDSGVIYVYTYDDFGRLQGTYIKEGRNGTKYYDRYITYDSNPASGQPTLSWAKKIYTFPEKVASTVAVTGAGGNVVEYDYTFWDDDKSRVKTREIILPLSHGAHTTLWEYYDKGGRLRWTKNGEGYVTYRAYQPSLGLLAYQVRDVDTGSLPGGITNPSSGLWEDWDEGEEDPDDIPTFFGRGTEGATLPDALNLITKQEYDDQGRRTLRTNPGGGRHFVLYDQTKTMVFPYIDGSGAPALPVQVEAYDNKLRNTDNYSVDPAHATAPVGGLPTGVSSDQADRVTWTHNEYDPVTSALVRVDNYHKIPSSGGSLGTNYYSTYSISDPMGRRAAIARYVSAGKYQVDAVLFNILDKPVETLRGVATQVPDDYSDLVAALGTTPTPDNFDGYAIVAIAEYDDGGVGDGHLTSTKTFFGPTVSSDYVKTIFHRTFRGHLRGIQKQTSSSSNITPFTAMDVDWMGRTVASAQYTSISDWSPLDSGYDDFVFDGTDPVTTGHHDLSAAHYDTIGLLDSTELYPGTEDSNHLLTFKYYDRRDNLVCTGDVYGAFTEIAYDGVNRQYQTRTVQNTSDPSPYSAYNVFEYCAPVPNPQVREMSGENGGVIELSHTEFFDNSSTAVPSMNVLEEHQFELNHDDSNGLSFSNGEASDGVRATVYYWYDTADRAKAMANYGSCNGSGGNDVWESNSLPTYGSSPPGASTAYLLLSEYVYYPYDPATGRQETASGPGGGETAVFYDNLGRRVAVAENHDDYDGPGDEADAGGGTNNEEDRVTKWAYNGASQVVTLTAVNVTPSSGTVDEITEYQYTNSYNARLATLTKYPDGSTSGADNVQMSYNLDGSIDTRVDQRGIKLTYVYDNSRRLIREEASVTSGTFASKGVDDSILSIGRTYDSLGRVETIGSNSAADGTGTVENEIKYTYHPTLGYLQKTEQSHQDAVAGGTPAVEYAHDESATSNIFTNGLRLATVTYPKTSRVIFYGYGAADSIGDRLSRVQEIRETDASSTQLTAYSYNGTSRLVVTDYQQPDVKLNLAGSTLGTYSGFDRFGRTIDQNWDGYNSTPDVDQIKYGYDSAGNRTWRENVVAAAQSTPVHLDEYYTYDGLHRLKSFDRGNLTGTAPNYTGIGGTPGKQQDWALDQLGNWAEFQEDEDGSGWDLVQLRTHNAVNEITAISATTGDDWHDPSYDAAGNMNFLPRRGSSANPSNAFSLTYDAWNRLTSVAAYSVGAIVEFEYDGLGRRIVKDLPGGTTNDVDFYYNEQWQLLEERKNSDTDPLAQYVWHPYYIDALAVRYYDASTSGSQVQHFYCQDANYNVTAVVNASGTVLERYNYTPYGEVTNLNPDFTAFSGTDIGNTHLYTGRERDPETGLQLNRHRYYASHLGRWLIRDPMEYIDGYNLYEYVGGKPSINTDPDGMDCPGCDLPDWLHSNDSACVRACCAEHDRCYHDHGCTSSSWAWNGGGAVIVGGFGASCTGGTGAIEGVVWGSWLSGFFSDCARCNDNVAHCILACGAAGNHMAGRPEYYCARKPWERFITIGPPAPGQPRSDFPNLPAARRACCN